MEEVQQEIQTPLEKRPSAAPIFISLFLAIYFLFPAILIYPVWYFNGKVFSPGIENPLNMIFYPMDKLYQTIPAYTELMDWEFHLLGMD